MQTELPCGLCKTPTREKGRQAVPRSRRHIEMALCRPCQEQVAGRQRLRIVRA